VGVEAFGNSSRSLPKHYPGKMPGVGLLSWYYT
jgi:hypothetical protein